jgi:hypothetical protein
MIKKSVAQMPLNFRRNASFTKKNKYPGNIFYIALLFIKTLTDSGI